MSRNYKFHNKEGLYFVSFATINWIDIFVRDEYFMDLVRSLAWCHKKKGMEIYSWCIMPSRVNLVFRAKDANPGELLKSFKIYTSKTLQRMIKEHPQESRREWILWMMERAGLKNSNVKNMQYWQQRNKPVELWRAEVIDQKVFCIHNNLWL